MGFSVEENKPPYKTANYRTAIAIPFENQENIIEGRFILGLHEGEATSNLRASGREI